MVTNMNNKSKRLLLILFLLFSPCLKADVIFWDLSETLVALNKYQAFGHLGKWNVLKLFLKSKMGSPLQSFKQYIAKEYFDALNQIKYNLPEEMQVNYNIYSEDGVTPLPPILRDSLLGLISYEGAKRLCEDWLRKTAFFDDETKREVFIKTFQLNFDPACFVAHQAPLKQIKLLQQCKNEVTPNGTKRHICIVLSNWVKEAVKPLKERFATEITPYIDCWIFSCDGFGAKPAQSIYQRCYDVVKEQFPEQLRQEWFFVDDQAVNRNAATKFVAHDFLCAHPDQAEFMLKKHGVISFF